MIFFCAHGFWLFILSRFFVTACARSRSIPPGVLGLRGPNVTFEMALGTRSTPCTTLPTRKYAGELEDLAGWCEHCHGYTHGKALWDPREDQTRVPLIDRADTPTPAHDAIVEVFQGLERRLSGETTGIPTGSVELDGLTGGLRKSELVILASRPSMGKTAMAPNVAEHAAINARTTVLIASMEMSRLAWIPTGPGGANILDCWDVE